MSPPHPQTSARGASALSNTHHPIRSPKVGPEQDVSRWGERGEVRAAATAGEKKGGGGAQVKGKVGKYGAPLVLPSIWGRRRLGD